MNENELKIYEMNIRLACFANDRKSIKELINMIYLDGGKAVRSKTIEECSKVAESHRAAEAPDRELPSEIAADIRALKENA